MLLQAVNFTGYRLIRRTLATSCNGKRNAWWPKCAATPSPRKIGRPVKIAFWPFLFTIFSLHVAFIPGCMLMFKVGKGTSPGVLNSLQQKFRFDISLIPHAQWNGALRLHRPNPSHSMLMFLWVGYKRAVLGTTILSDGALGTFWSDQPKWPDRSK